MRRLRLRRPIWACALLIIAAGAHNGASAQHPRRTPIVEAVEKTRAGIVTVKVDKRDGSSVRNVGTGIVVDERGYILTNRHVLAAARQVAVCLQDGKELQADIVAVDAETDLAIIRAKQTAGLQALTLGSGNDLLVGETVIAIGHPYGYSHTVSTGIISALGRCITMPTGELLTNLIQTDASINPGNSGGPLLNINGELIGVNVALREGANGIAFAINVDTVKQVLSRHLGAAKVAGVRHGISCSDRTSPKGYQGQHVIITAVDAEAPATAAGLRPGDEILRVANCPIANRFDVERALWDSKPGDRVPFMLIRQAKELKVTLTLAPAKAAAATRR
jgi:serine protease Do